MCQKTAKILLQTFEREHNKKILAPWSSHNPNKRKSRNVDKQRAAIKIKTDHRYLKSRRSHDIQQISFSFNCKKCPKTFKSKIRISSDRKIKHKDVRRTRDLYVWKRKSTLGLSD
jgi:hypothetical protein